MRHWQDVVALYARWGHLEYAGEGVSQLVHAWQCGRMALRAQASPALQAAAWLHDLGHLLDGEAGTPTLRGHDDRHERRGAALLESLFGPDVARPVALHVEAKRYLVAVRADYLERLSDDSRRSLALQGGPMSTAELDAWHRDPHAQDALRLRTWDDMAKDVGRRPDVPVLDELRALLARCARN